MVDDAWGGPSGSAWGHSARLSGAARQLARAQVLGAGSGDGLRVRFARNLRRASLEANFRASKMWEGDPSGWFI